MGVVLTLRAKGVGGLVTRAGMIASRFGPTPSRMERCLNHYADLAEEIKAPPTLPVTACVLARHPALFRKLVDRGVEFAIHGLVHNDHAVLSLDEQRESIALAAAAFQAAGVPCTGFRGPYLRYNQATDEALRALDLRYHSSQAVAFAVLPREIERGLGSTTYRRALNLYGALDATEVVVRPRNRRGLIDIPVAVPDDEIMVDRLHLTEAAQTAAWLAMLNFTHHRGELFTMQLHPERIFDCAVALRAVVAEARRRQPGIWVVKLDEIASWWLRRGQLVPQVDQLAQDRYRVHLAADPDATFLVRGMPAVIADPWYGDDFVARVRSFEVDSPVKPVVGVSSRSPRAVLDFLREEGLPAETSDERTRFGAYVDLQGDLFDEVGLLAELERAPGPLVRLGRWPAGARSALAVTGDIDAITLQDFALRLWETRSRSSTPPSPPGSVKGI